MYQFHAFCLFFESLKFCFFISLIFAFEQLKICSQRTNLLISIITAQLSSTIIR